MNNLGDEMKDIFFTLAKLEWSIWSTKTFIFFNHAVKIAVGLLQILWSFLLLRENIFRGHKIIAFKSLNNNNKKRRVKMLLILFEE